MRDYGKVHASFWASETLKDLDADAKLLALYLLTSPHSNMIGAFRLPDAYACEDLGWVSERFRKGLETLEKAGFIKFDKSWVWVVNHLRFNRPENPNQWKAAGKLAAVVPDSVSFKCAILERVSEPFRNSPVPDPIPVPDSVLAAEVAIPISDGSEHPVTATDIAEFRSAYPKIDPLAEARKARAWCIANPTKQKTRRGVGKFLNGWMDRANKDAAANQPAPNLAHVPGGGRQRLA